MNFVNTISKGNKVRFLFNPKLDILTKGDVVTVSDIAVNIETGVINIIFEEDHNLLYEFSTERFELV